MQELDEGQKLCGKPLLVADMGNWCVMEMNQQGKSALNGYEERGRDDEEVAGMLMEQSWCVGVHWRGYIEKKTGEWGAVDPFDETDGEVMEAIPACNRLTLKDENFG